MQLHTTPRAQQPGSKEQAQGGETPFKKRQLLPGGLGISPRDFYGISRLRASAAVWTLTFFLPRVAANLSQPRVVRSTVALGVRAATRCVCQGPVEADTGSARALQASCSRTRRPSSVSERGMVCPCFGHAAVGSLLGNLCDAPSLRELRAFGMMHTLPKYLKDRWVLGKALLSTALGHPPPCNVRIPGMGLHWGRV